MGKRVASGILAAAMGVVGSGGLTSHAASLEDSQPAAVVIVTKAKELAKVQVEHSKATREAATDDVRAMLSSCSDRTRHSFLESLVLVDGKFAGANVRIVQECLGESGYQKFRDLFGLQTPGTKDNAKHWCASRATCRKNEAICTSNCRSDKDAAKIGKEDDGYLSFREMLGNCSDAERDRFFDSVSWKDGRIQTAELSSIRRCGSKTSRLLAAME